MQHQKFDPTKPVIIATPETRTAEGREISARNATTHGCCSATLILPTENVQDFEALEASWYRAFGTSPKSLKDEAEVGLISKLILADWLARRATRNYIQVEAKLLIAQPDQGEWTEEQHKTLTRSLRYRTANNNAFEKHRRAVEDFRKKRAEDVARTQKLRVAEEKLSITQERLKTAQKKNAPEPSWADHLDAMRQKAISLGYTPPDGPNPARR